MGSGGSFPASGSTASEDCQNQLADYFNGDYSGNYWQDVARIAAGASSYFSALPAFPIPQRQQQQVVVFDIDETALSNSEFFGFAGRDRSYYNKWTSGNHWEGRRKLMQSSSMEAMQTSARGDAWASAAMHARTSSHAVAAHTAPHHLRSLLGSSPNDWPTTATLPALQDVLNLYNTLYGLGFSLAFVTGRSEGERTSTSSNLQTAGYGALCPPVSKSAARPLQPCYVDLKMRLDGDARWVIFGTVVPCFLINGIYIGIGT